MDIEVIPGSVDQVSVSNIDFRRGGSDVDAILSLIYKKKIVILKNQNLSVSEYLEMSRLFGDPETYYQSMYHHPVEKEVFVSSNVLKDGKQVGVPGTGKFWHADYAFMKRPFAITMIYPQIIPSLNRGTYFIDMGKVYEGLPEETKELIEGSYCVQSAKKYFKIRPSDVYRPLCDVLKDVEEETPDVQHKTVFEHPFTKEKILYINEGFSRDIFDRNGNSLDASLLEELLTFSGQKDKTFSNPFIHLQTFEEGDLLMWDNRSLVHCALHAKLAEAAESFRITLHDKKEFYHGIAI